MKKTRLLLALLALPLLTVHLHAATVFTGNTVNLGQFGGTVVSLGSKTGASSIPVVIASDQGTLTVTGTGGTFPVTGTFWQANQPVSFAAGATIAVASAPVAGLYSPTLQSLSAGTTAVMNLDVQGNLVTRNMGAGMARNVPVTTRVGATTSSGALLAGNANRVGLECDTDCSNTDRVYIRWGASSATSSDKRIDVCGSWTPPAVSTTAIQVLAASGTQNVTCIEYANQ